jgi:hypothetical protein
MFFAVVLFGSIPPSPREGNGDEAKKDDSQKTKASSSLFPDPVFVNLLGSPGIDSQPGGPVQQPYRNWFLGNDY